MRKPKSIFVLESITTLSDRYPRRKASVATVAFCSTLERAEQALRRLIDDEQLYEKDKPRKEWDLYRVGYLISERAVDAFMRQRFDMAADWVYNLRIRSYTPDGAFVCENSTPELAPNYEFFGRKPEDIRFHHGDIVEVFGYGFAELCIVDLVPPTPERIAERIERGKQMFPDDWETLSRLDYTDDCYLVYCLGEGDTHDHPLSYTVLPPSKPVSEKYRQMLKDKLAEMDELHKDEYGNGSHI